MTAPADLLPDRLAQALAQRGCTTAFGVSGAAIGRFSRSLADAGLRVVHPRHEGGAAFMAGEFALSSRSPGVVFTTSGPGFSNAITGLVASAWEGAHTIAIVGGTPRANRGRFPFQSTQLAQLDLSAWMPPDVPFVAYEVHDEASLHATLEVVDAQLASPTGSSSLILLPSDATAACAAAPPPPDRPVRAADSVDVERVVQALRGRRVLVWVGHGARHAVDEVHALVEALEAVVVATPRGKGIVPETHPRYLGVLGLGGARGVAERLEAADPDVALVIGARFSEFTSWWDARLIPREGLVVVGCEEVGAGFPTALHVRAEPAPLFRAVLPALEAQPFAPLPSWPPETFASPPEALHPGAVMEEVQTAVVERGIPVVSEAGNAFAWATRVLRFGEPLYRVSPDFGAMGQASAGVVGMALARGGKAVALLGDGAVLMNNELSTAVATGAAVVWIVLNDAAYGMIVHGMHAIGLEPVATSIPRVDFVAFARAQGADGVHAHDRASLGRALEAAVHASGPFVIDVAVDPTVPPPFGARNRALVQEPTWQG